MFREMMQEHDFLEHCYMLSLLNGKKMQLNSENENICKKTNQIGGQLVLGTLFCPSSNYKNLLSHCWVNS